mmetsp:Transcript_34515/g.6220  ORF Transcript_34515/g.6220 Transcript_34515/m.6220 type:complete len:83 (-) Transcript_34515:483-731(-)
MNATSSLTLDEDLSFRLRMPHRLANVLGVIVMAYWYYYHVHLYQADTFRYRLRSYHTYKMWSRLEILATKHSIGSGDEFMQM